MLLFEMWPRMTKQVAPRFEQTITVYPRGLKVWDKVPDSGWVYHWAWILMSTPDGCPILFFLVVVCGPTRRVTKYPPQYTSGRPTQCTIVQSNSAAVYINHKASLGISALWLYACTMACVWRVQWFGRRPRFIEYIDRMILWLSHLSTSLLVLQLPVSLFLLPCTSVCVIGSHVCECRAITFIF